MATSGRDQKSIWLSAFTAFLLGLAIGKIRPGRRPVPPPPSLEPHPHEKLYWWTSSIGTIIAALASIVAAALAGGALWEYNRQANAAEENNRAWLEVNSFVMSQFEVNDAQAIGKALLHISNGGHAPATNIQEKAEIAVPDMTDAEEDAKTYCEREITDFKPSSKTIGNILFPSSLGVDWPAQAHLDTAVIAKKAKEKGSLILSTKDFPFSYNGKKTFTPGENGYLMKLLADSQYIYYRIKGCFFYTYLDKTHYTSYGYDIYLKSGPLSLLPQNEKDSLKGQKFNVVDRKIWSANELSALANTDYGFFAN